jgi:hypothetical protein
MTHDVDDHAVGFTDEEPSHAPRLIGERIHDLEASRDGLRVGRVDIVDLHGRVGMRRGRRILTDQADLG